MNAFKKIAATAIAVATLAGFAGQANAYTIWAKNNSKNAIWISVYLYGGHNQNKAWFCILPGEEKSGSHNTIGNVGGGVYVRAELKDSATSCGNHSNKHDVTTSYVEVSRSNRTMVIWTNNSKGQRPWYDASKWH